MKTAPSEIIRPGGSATSGSLVVFSDDWGRHPSSCQHLVRQLLPDFKVLWVNTIGTRAPRLDLQTFRRVAEKVMQWGRRSSSKGTESSAKESIQNHPNLTVVNPKMWPWFSTDRDRALNRWLLTRQLNSLIGKLPQPVIALTTLPITADLPGHLSVGGWLYYCVDDFSVWPGLDGQTLRRMDQDMIRRADTLIAVSETLQGMIAAEGRTSQLMTHGVDVDFWRNPTEDSLKQADALLDGTRGRRIVFWGVIDRRLETAAIRQLSNDCPNDTLVFIGPQQDPDPEILNLPNVVVRPPQSLNILPGIAARSSVLMMPYANLPVTRAMQPLKLKEYLATGQAVVVNRLPSTESWEDCMDVSTSPQEFSRLVQLRLSNGVEAEQLKSRHRLDQESWLAKSQILKRTIGDLFTRRNTTEAAFSPNVATIPSTGHC
ncbi:MAG: hypothetical protein JNM43_05220 [Planctomycetaceae bacterium]|nr:hypothetical protein [Planctomycetaceae bacterium]